MFSISLFDYIKSSSPLPRNRLSQTQADSSADDYFMYNTSKYRCTLYAKYTSII